MNKHLRRFLFVFLGVLGLMVAALAAAIAFGTGDVPAVHQGIALAGNRIAAELRAAPPPDVTVLQARDGTPLAFRLYPGDAKKVVVLVHGSSGSSTGVHALSRALAGAGYTVYAPDIRGHGGSGARGDISYIGQLEDDMEDLVGEIARRNPGAARVLIGHSSGGGFALRIAATPRTGKLFSGFMLLSPFLGADAPSYRPNAGGWAQPYLPRIIGLSIINGFGISNFNHLTAIAFAVPPEARQYQVAFYSFALLANFAPHRDWREDLRQVAAPTILMAGGDDELFYADKFQAAVDEAKAKIRVELVYSVDHMGIVLNRLGQEAVLRELRLLLP